MDADRQLRNAGRIIDDRDSLLAEDIRAFQGILEPTVSASYVILGDAAIEVFEDFMDCSDEATPDENQRLRQTIVMYQSALTTLSLALAPYIELLSDFHDEALEKAIRNLKDVQNGIARQAD